MKLSNIFQNYVYCLIHPFKTHELYLANKEDENGYKPHILGIYESLGTSWVFVVISGILRIALINLVFFSFFDRSQVYLQVQLVHLHLALGSFLGRALS